MTVQSPYKEAAEPEYKPPPLPTEDSAWEVTLTLVELEPQTVRLVTGDYEMVLLDAGGNQTGTVMINGTNRFIRERMTLDGVRMTVLSTAERAVARPRTSSARLRLYDGKKAYEQTMIVNSEKDFLVGNDNIRVRLAFIELVEDEPVATFMIQDSWLTIGMKDNMMVEGVNATLKGINYYDATWADLRDAMTVVIEAKT